MSEKNVRAVSLTLPALFDPVSVVRALDVFVDQVLKWDGRFHIVGAGMGGYIAQLYCQMRAMRVSSLFLINAFCDLDFHHSIFASVLPTFLMSSSLLETVPKETSVPGVEAAAFIKILMDEFSLFEISSKLALENYSEVSPMCMCSVFFRSLSTFPVSNHMPFRSSNNAHAKVQTRLAHYHRRDARRDATF